MRLWDIVLTPSMRSKSSESSILICFTATAYNVGIEGPLNDWPCKTGRLIDTDLQSPRRFTIGFLLRAFPGVLVFVVCFRVASLSLLTFVVGFQRRETAIELEISTAPLHDLTLGIVG